MSEEGKKSLFNSGVAMTERIHALQQAINAARFNLTAYNYEVNKFNYEVMVSSNDGLLMEVWSKLTSDEQKKGERVRKLVSEFIRTFPIVYSNNGEYKINNKNLEKFKQLIVMYEQMNKIFLDVHNLNSPNFEDDDYL